jgi:outer membrane lipoprotein SlyB
MPEGRQPSKDQSWTYDSSEYESAEFYDRAAVEEPEPLTTRPVLRTVPAETGEVEAEVPDHNNMLRRIQLEQEHQTKMNERVWNQEYRDEFMREAHDDLDKRDGGQGLGLGVVSPDENYQFEGHSGADAKAAQKLYKQNDPDMRFSGGDSSLIDPEAPPDRTVADTMRNVVNFVFSDEMALMGMKWNKDGLKFAFDNVKHQMLEHPYSTAFTMASYAVPLGAAWMKGARIASRAAQITDKGAAAGKGFLGTKLGFRFENHSDLVKKLALTEANDGKKLFGDELVEKLKFASADEVEKLMPRKDLRKILSADAHDARFYMMLDKAKRGKLEGIKEEAEWGMWKMFGNKYFKALNETNQKQLKNLDDFYEKGQFGKYLAGVPTHLGDEGEKSIYKFWSGIDDFDTMAKSVGDETATWAESMRVTWTDLTKSQYDEGFISESTYKMWTDDFGNFHLPAIKKGTAGFTDLASTSAEGVAGKFEGIATKNVFDPAKALTGPTTLTRGKYTTKGALLEDLDQLITNPKALTTGGFLKDNMVFQGHRMFRDVIMDGMSGSPKAAQWVASQEEFALMPKYAQKEWINISELDNVVPGLTSTVERMIDKGFTKAGGTRPPGPLPAIDRTLVEQFFGKEGSALSEAGNIQKFFELLTAVHKTSRTSLNPTTHSANLIGNLAMLCMAGMNPWSRTALNDGKTFTKAFTQLAKLAHRGKAEAKAGKAGTVFDSVESLMNKETLTELFGKDNIIKGVNGESINLAEFFSDDLVKGMIEASAFENIEGFAHLKKLLESLDKAQSRGFGTGALKVVGQAITGAGEARGVKQTLEGMSSAYLAEDMIPKMMYCTNLLRKGWGRDAIIREVGRRLPQYKTVGDLPAASRRMVLPWITFPAEMTRIMKNNMMDAPISTSMWLQAPEALRAATYTAGLGPNFEEHEKVIDAAPSWAVRYQTAMVKEEKAPEALMTIGGGSMGAMVGGAVGGAKGAAIGAGVGAAAGYALGKSQETPEERMAGYRSWVADFLPQSAIFPGSTHPRAFHSASLQNENIPGGEWLKAVTDMSPVEPMAVLMPLLDMYQGKGSFGEDMPSVGAGIVSKMAMSLMGFLSPPMMQKYGMKVEGPQMNPIPMTEIQANNGGRMTLPKNITATFGGLAAGGVTFLGSKYGMGLKGVALAAPTALAGVMGSTAGNEINVRRLMTDLGIMGDPVTQKKGQWTLDAVANNFFGTAKSWPANAPRKIVEDNRKRRHYSEIRGQIIRDITDATLTKRTNEANYHLSRLYENHLSEWGNAEMAFKKYIESVEAITNSWSKTPQYAGISKEWVENRIEALNASADELSKIQKQELSELKALNQKQQMDKARNLKIVK